MGSEGRRVTKVKETISQSERQGMRQGEMGKKI